MKPWDRIAVAALIAICLASCWGYAYLYASHANIGLKAGVVDDFYPLWNAAHAMLDRVDVYGPEVTLQNQLHAYGALGSSVGEANDQHTAYPAYALWAIVPFAVFPYAHWIGFLALGLLAACSVGWLRGKWDGTTLAYSALFFSFYPVIFSLQSGQLTLLFFGISVACYWLFRRGNFVGAALLAALAIGKPHIGLPVVLPLALYALAFGKRQFMASLVAFSSVLMLLTEWLQPGWVDKWLASLQSFSRYTRPSLAISMLGERVGWSFSLIAIVLLLAILWRNRNSYPLGNIALAVVVFQIVGPYQPYNTVMLLIPVAWILEQTAEGTAAELSVAAVRMAIALIFVGNLVGIGLWLAKSPLAIFIPGVTAKALLWCVALALASLTAPDWLRSTIRGSSKRTTRHPLPTRSTP